MMFALSSVLVGGAPDMTPPCFFAMPDPDRHGVRVRDPRVSRYLRWAWLVLPLAIMLLFERAVVWGGLDAADGPPLDRPDRPVLRPPLGLVAASSAVHRLVGRAAARRPFRPRLHREAATARRHRARSRAGGAVCPDLRRDRWRCSREPRWPKSTSLRSRSLTTCTSRRSERWCPG